MFLLFILTLLEFVIILLCDKNILSPSVIFALVFLISEFNLFTNITSLGITIKTNTILIIVSGIFFFWLGELLVAKISLSNKSVTNFNINMLNREFSLSNWKLIILILFNLISSILIAKTVVSLTYGAGYAGDFWGAFGRYRELSAIGGDTNLRLSTFPTLLTSLTKAEGYIIAFIVAKLLVEKKKVNYLVWITLITAFITTFCQGDRGGLVLAIAFLFNYIFLMEKNNRYHELFNFRNILKLIVIIVIIIFVFNISAIVAGKRWDVPFYQYFSVYLGGPIVNLNELVENGIPSSPLWGYFTFGNIIQFVYRHIGKVFPFFNINGFNIFNGINTGNVYTIFAYLISDFGYVGCQIILFCLGIVMQLGFTIAKQSKNNFSISIILYCFFLGCLSLSFFSDKVFENISVFNLYTFVFNFLFISFLSTTKNSKV